MNNPASARPAAEWTLHSERGSALLLRIMCHLSLRLGRTVTRPLIYGIAGYFFVFAPQARRYARVYLRRVLGRPATAADRFRQVLSFASCIHDRVYLIKGRYEAFDISVEGEALVQQLMHEGRGAFLMGAHLGSFEVIGSLGRRQPGLRVAMAMYEANARKINAILAALDATLKSEIITLGRMESMLKIRERLDAGMFVGMLADRTLGDETVQQVPLFGTPAPLPIGPMRAAALLGRRVIFMAGMYRGSNRYQVIFEPLADFSTVAAPDRAPAIEAAVSRYGALLEKYCRSAPYNWFNFFDFWRERQS